MSRHFEVNNILTPHQHGFRKGFSTQIQFILILHDWYTSRIMCSLRTPRPICRPTSRPICRSTSVGRGVLVEHRLIWRPVCRPLCRPMLDRYVGRYSGRHSADFLTVEYRSSVGGVSVDCRWSIGRLSYNINQKFKLSVPKV